MFSPVMYNNFVLWSWFFLIIRKSQFKSSITTFAWQFMNPRLDIFHNAALMLWIKFSINQRYKLSMYDINKMKLQYINLHVQQLQVRFLLLLFFVEGGGAIFVFFLFNLSYGPSLWSILVTLNGSIYTFESSQTTIDNLNKHFPTIYIVSQQHILRDLYRGYNSFWFILCEQIFSDTIAKGVVADRNVGGNVGKWVQTSWGDGRVEG
jgi:hypothetical protein